MQIAPLSSAWLIPLPGNPSLLRFELKPGGAHGLVLGRAKDCELRLPAEIEKISRHHLRFLDQEGQWSVVDLASRWGTRLNGIKIAANCPTLLKHGDRIDVDPCAFRFSANVDSFPTTVSEPDNETTILRELAGASTEVLRQDLLNLLLEASTSFYAVENEQSLAIALADFACRGCALDIAAVVRPVNAEGGVEVLAFKSLLPIGDETLPRFSRALLTAAAKGIVAEYSAGDGKGSATQTLIQAGIASAICAPLMIGSTVYAHLYVHGTKTLREQGSDFCQALARLGGLAMANLQRVEIERRAAQMRSALGAAAATQRVILPQMPFQAGPFLCAGRSQPGDGYLAGDFFDLQIVADGRLVLSLGDVSGHGVQSSILMAAAQGFLHASLADHGDLLLAASALNRFVAGHSHRAQYITLWLGLLDPNAMTLSYINAGHGYAYLIPPRGDWQTLDERAGTVVGINPDEQYKVVTISRSADEKLLILSDGFIEQPQTSAIAGEDRTRFGLDGVQRALHGAGDEGMIDRLFDAVQCFAGSTKLVDDVTALLIRWPQAGPPRKS
jgi:serine phosphatase RsbU (regulator of sigma subunit)